MRFGSKRRMKVEVLEWWRSVGMMEVGGVWGGGYGSVYGCMHVYVCMCMDVCMCMMYACVCI